MQLVKGGWREAASVRHPSIPGFLFNFVVFHEAFFYHTLVFTAAEPPRDTYEDLLGPMSLRLSSVPTRRWNELCGKTSADIFATPNIADLNLDSSADQDLILSAGNKIGRKTVILVLLVRQVVLLLFVVK